MPKAKPISLHPLSFDEAIKALTKTTSQSEKKTKTNKKKKA
jgi:hypothetical protein